MKSYKDIENEVLQQKGLYNPTIIRNRSINYLNQLALNKKTSEQHRDNLLEKIEDITTKNKGGRYIDERYYNFLVKLIKEPTPKQQKKIIKFYYWTIVVDVTYGSYEGGEVKYATYRETHYVKSTSNNQDTVTDQLYEQLIILYVSNLW